MTHPHERALEAAARAVKVALQKHDYFPAEEIEEEITRAAVTAYIAALQETHALVPREATEAMHIAGFRERRMQDHLNMRHHVVINTSAIYRAMIDAAPPATEAGDGWMPIETAPKATYPETEIRILLWGPSFKNMTVIGWWRGTVSGGIWFNSEDEGGIGWGECKPTHWRPLPAPPAAQEKK
jgi:hypothetical protein